jgi:hypothetical protein
MNHWVCLSIRRGMKQTGLQPQLHVCRGARLSTIARSSHGAQPLRFSGDRTLITENSIERCRGSFDYKVRLFSASTPILYADQLQNPLLLLAGENNIDSLERAHARVVAATENDDLGRPLDNARIAVFDAWMHYFDQLVDTLEGATSHSILADLRRSVEQAQALLELLIPTLRHNKHGLSEFLIRNTTPTDLELQSQSSDNRQRSNVPLSMRCDTLLRALGALSRVGHGHRHRIALYAIPQRAQYILDQMESTFAAQPVQPENKHIVLRPTVESYNAVLEAWAYSQEHLRGNMADQVFQRIPRPNGDSYRLVIRAWCQSRDRRAAFHATGHLMKMLRRLENGEEDFEPVREDYHILLIAWESAEDKTSPSKAQSVLRLMELSYDKGITAIQPDLACYRSVLKTAAQRPSLPELGRLVDDILVKMKDHYIVPDAECFSAAIRTWRNCAIHPDNFEFRELAVRRALELLAEMNIAHTQSTTLSVRPSTVNVNDVLEALSASKHPKRTSQAEQLLDSLEEGFENEHVRPNADSYRFTINIWGTTNAAERVPRALAILWRMKERYNTLILYSRQQDIIEVYNAFVRVCGSVRCQGEDAGLSIFKEALTSVENMKLLDGLRANSQTYAALLEACKNLLPLGHQRQLVVEEVFLLCAGDGMVDEHVLRMLRLVATMEQYARLVIAESDDVEGTKSVPEAWTVNVLGGRVLTSDGRRTTPLTIDGQLTETLAMKEFQMRRLRDKRNRNLLQGGRLRERDSAMKYDS